MSFNHKKTNTKLNINTNLTSNQTQSSNPQTHKENKSFQPSTEQDEERECLTKQTFDHNDYKVKSTDIKLFHDLTKMREDKLKHINTQISYVDKLSKDAFIVTQSSGEKINSLYDNIESAFELQEKSNEIVSKTVTQAQGNGNKVFVVVLLIISICLLCLFNFRE